MRDAIIRGIARAFFACAWADYQEERNGTLIACEITEVMPQEIDPGALTAADALVAAFEKKYSETVEEIFGDYPGPYKGDPQKWGHYFAMQAMEQGVGLWEDIPQFAQGGLYKIPTACFYSWDLEKEYEIVTIKGRARQTA